MASIIPFLFTLGIIIATSAVGRASEQRISGTGQDEREKREVNSMCNCNQEKPPRDCGEIYDQLKGESFDGICTIKPDGAKEPFEVYCNNTIDGGGWTVFQRRVDGLENFNRNWTDYKEGFGCLHGEFWLGNEKLFLLTNQKDYEIRIDLVNVDGVPFFAKYELFRIGDEGSQYKLIKINHWDEDSSAPNVFGWQRDRLFSTPDRDSSEKSSRECPDRNRSAWWYINCYRDVDLNRPSLGKEGHPLSPYWYNLTGNEFLMYTEMKIRPV